MQKYYPLYSGIDNKTPLSEYYTSPSFYGTYTPSQPFTMNFQYQDVVNQLQKLTHTYNNLPHNLHQHKLNIIEINFLTTSPPSPQTLYFISIPLTTISTPLYHDYRLNNKHT